MNAMYSKPILRVLTLLALLCTFLLTFVTLLAAEESRSRPAASQSTSSEKASRKEQLLEQRRERLAKVKPAKRSKVVELLTTVENDGFDQLVTVQARHWRFGFGKISPVSGATPAVQYERPRLGGSGVRLRAAGAYSVRGYQSYEFRLGWFDEPAPYKLSGSGFLGAPFDFDNRSPKRPRNFLYADLRYRDFPQEEFYGLGPDSLESSRTDYLYQDAAFDAAAGLQPLRWIGLEFRLGFMPTSIGTGKNDNLGNVEDLFSPAEVPGLALQPDFLHLNSALYLAWEGDPNYPAAELGFNFSRFNDIDLDRFTFNRFSADARGFLPLGSRQRTLAARFFVSRDFADSGQQVPFYMMETLGGHNTLRGYRDFRFRDSNVLYLSGEYRWEATAGVELAVFYDTGKVFPDRSGFTFEHLRHSFGGGLRAKSLRRVVFRIEAGRSEEGTFIFVSFGPSF